MFERRNVIFKKFEIQMRVWYYSYKMLKMLQL